MPTNSNRRTTKHEELTRTLMALAQSLQAGDLFPSQTELMRRYQVSDRTVLRSLDDLKRAGWIVRRHGKGTFVADPAERKSEPPAPPVAAQSQTVGALALAYGPFYQHCVNLLSVQAEAAGLALV